MPLTALTIVRGPSFANVSYTSLSTNTIIVTGATIANTVSSTSVFLANSYAVTLTAGETIAVNDAVYLEPSRTQATAGRVYKMNGDVLRKSTQAFFLGFALDAVSAGANVTVQVAGVVSGFSSLTTGALYYAGTTAGAVTATKPWYPIPIGIAISTTAILINQNKLERDENEGVSAVYGYTFGGAPTTNTTDRVTFATSTVAGSTVGRVSVAKYTSGSVSDVTRYGYVAGGLSGAGSSLTTVDRIQFSTGVTAVNTGSNIGTGRQSPASISDGALWGYLLAGFAAALSTTTDRISFASGVSQASTATTVGTARDKMSSLSDGITYGYLLGGLTATSSGPVATGERLTFSTAAINASTTYNLSSARGEVVSVSDNSLYGYSCGGTTSGAAAGGVVTGDRTTFSTSATAAQTSSNLSSARSGLQTGSSDGAVYGYILGGINTGGTTIAGVNRLTFSTSTTATSAQVLSEARRWNTGLSDGAV